MKGKWEVVGEEGMGQSWRRRWRGRDRWGRVRGGGVPHPSCPVSVPSSLTCLLWFIMG